MNQRRLINTALRVPAITAVILLTACGGKAKDYSEANIAELHDQMQRGELQSEELVRWYRDQIAAIDRAGPELRAIIELNPDALMTARALDEEWQESGPRGPLHGIPVVLKANIDTADKMHTTAGSQALADHIPPQDAFLVSQLRDAGAVILGKANLSEWANYRSSRSSSGWSSIGGQTRNPYDRLRTPCGSSSGSAVAVAANLTVVAIGTETNGSVICPAGINGIVGIKPTVGLVSRSGIIPIAHSQDTAGPMARTVRDAAILLSAMTGTDPEDPASSGAPAATTNYAANLAADGLRGRRIGIIRSYMGAGSNPAVETLLTASISTMRAAGAEIVDEIRPDVEGANTAARIVLAYEFKSDLAAYFERSGAAFETLADIIAFNKANAATAMPIFGQERMIAADASGDLGDGDYLDALKASKQISQSALDDVYTEHRLDALVAVTNGPAWMIDHANGDSFHIGSSSYAAVAGYPSITVPAGFVSDLPIGISFIGPAFSEKSLIEIAYAFEQATAARRAPALSNDVTK
jgi:amidase